MATDHPLRDKTGDSEKITINLGYIDLGRIDLLVQEGFYSNRTDFIRTAIRNQLTTHGDAVSKSIDRHMLELGLRDITRADLEAAKGHRAGAPCQRRHPRPGRRDNRVDHRPRRASGPRRGPEGFG